MGSQTTQAFIGSGGGLAGEALRETDWAATALGSPERWPQALIAHVRTMLHSRQPMCIFWGPDLINLYNDAMLPILGEKHPAAMGQRAADCWREVWRIVGPQLDRVLQGENVYLQQVMVPISRGGRVDDAWWNYSYSPLFDDAGAVSGALVICTEVTAEVLAREQIEELAIQQAAGREHAEAMRRQAEAANRAKDEFLATVSHELRTPLTAILGWSRMLSDSPDRARVAKGIAVIERNARAQEKIIADILDAARIISGKLRLSLREVDFTSVIEAAAESLRPAAAAKQLALHVDTPSRISLVADEGRLQQVVWNLLSNAIKFTPRGGEVTVRATRRGDHVQLRVTDSGNGISPEFLPYVFDRFRQDDASTTKQQPGLGLGLAIVRHLVELHGGTVSAASAGEGRGATFEVSLPIVVVRAGDRPPLPEVAGEPSVPAAAAGRDRLRGVRALVVDDEQDARELVATVLEEAGAVVFPAGSASAALEIAAGTDVSVIVSDIAMPGSDGYALLERIRAAPRTRDVPALALTAYARAEDRDRALASGFQEHLVKPIEPARLVLGVAALLGR